MSGSEILWGFRELEEDDTVAQHVCPGLGEWAREEDKGCLARLVGGFLDGASQIPLP